MFGSPYGGSGQVVNQHAAGMSQPLTGEPRDQR
jgi:hypothetical protein